MEICYVHFYVEDSIRERNYFIDKMGFQPIKNGTNCFQNSEFLVNNGITLILSSPVNGSDSVAKYLKNHPSGVSDIAIRVKSIDSFQKNLLRLGKSDYSLSRQSRLMDRIVGKRDLGDGVIYATH